METIGFILIGSLVLAVWIAAKIGVDRSREVCAEANLNESMGERIRQAKEEWDAMSEEEDDSFWEDWEEDRYLDPIYSFLAENIHSD